ncbi:hypothetical protein BGZ61DRAFT_374057 [Ilyonectria robusta]|uniref:uncharacterized protein n=1 Tax=Ilyonectria robusta TaxID=1079257 RepID=UPI001E8E1D07|nr:uncharacterized protein BGZ61DRAFT_374057 [Ilyonectria robusta]KAH8653919.1 hypothetical protein BGZ61DRAFT_374057 [Ilyonectria robusta]
MASTETTTVAPSAASPRLFQFDRTAFSGHHYDIKSVTETRSFYAGISSFTRKKPDLTLHEGTSDKGAIKAVCHMEHLRGNSKIGLGDPAKPDSVQWEDMTKESVFKASKYRWETALTNSSTPRRGREVLLWKRTQSVGVGGSSPSGLSVRNWKLVHEGTGEILAVFTSDGPLTKCEGLEVRANFGDAFDQMVMITCLTLYEAAKRRGGGC